MVYIIKCFVFSQDYLAELASVTGINEFIEKFIKKITPLNSEMVAKMNTAQNNIESLRTTQGKTVTITSVRMTRAMNVRIEE